MTRVLALRHFIPRLPYKAIAFAALAAFLVWSWMVQKPAPSPESDPNVIIIYWT